MITDENGERAGQALYHSKILKKFEIGVKKIPNRTMKEEENLVY